MMTKGRSVRCFPRGREERGERKGLRVVMMRAIAEVFEGASGCRGLLSERRLCRGLLCLVDVLMTSVREDERVDSICLEWKTDLVP